MPSNDYSRVSSGSGKVYLKPEDSANPGATASTGASASVNALLGLDIAALAGVKTVAGRNIGKGKALYAGTNGKDSVVLEFKTFVPGNGVFLIENDETITITTDASNGKPSFLSLLEAPDRITKNGVLVGTNDGNLGFTLAPTVTGTVLTFNGIGFVWTTPVTGTVRSVGLTGTSDMEIAGDPITDTGAFRVGLANTGVTAGLYTAATIQVDEKGRLISAASTPVGEVNTLRDLGTGAGLTGAKSDTALGIKSLAATGLATISATDETVTLDVQAVSSVALQGDADIVVSGNTITSTGTFTLHLGDTGVAPGTYNVVTVDEKGRVTAASVAAAHVPDSAANLGDGAKLFAQKVEGEYQFRTLKGGTSVTLTETANAVTIDVADTTEITVTSDDLDVTGSPVHSTGTIGLALKATGVAAGEYTIPTLSVDDKGRVVAIASTNAVRSVDVLGTKGIVASGGPITSTGTILVSLEDTAVVPGTYSAARVTVDQQGRITAIAETPVAATVSASNLGTGKAVLASSANSALTFRTLVAGENIEIAETANAITITAVVPAGEGGGTVTEVNVEGDNGVVVTGGPIVSNGTVTVGLANSGVVAGTYSAATITVDEFGRVTSAANTAIEGAGGAGTVTSVEIKGSDAIVVEGNAITEAGVITLDLANTGVVAGTYARATVTVDPQGRVIEIEEGAEPAPSLVVNGNAVTEISVSGAETAFDANTGTIAITIPAAMHGTVTSVGLTGSADIVVTGNTVTEAGAFALELANTTVTPGTYAYATVTVDQKGRVTGINANAAPSGDGEGFAAENLSAGSAQVFKQANASTLEFRSLTAGTGLTISQDATTVTLAANTAGLDALTVRADGFDTDIDAINAALTSLTTRVDGATANTGVTPGTYRSVTVNAAGRVTAGSAPVQKHSDLVVVTNATITTYGFKIGGAALALDPAFLTVFVNRLLLRPSEYSVSANSITFSIALNTSDELEVITIG